jgi:hypothetical protein
MNIRIREVRARTSAGRPSPYWRVDENYGGGWIPWPHHYAGLIEALTAVEVLHRTICTDQGWTDLCVTHEVQDQAQPRRV